MPQAEGMVAPYNKLVEDVRQLDNTTAQLDARYEAMHRELRNGVNRALAALVGPTASNVPSSAPSTAAPLPPPPHSNVSLAMAAIHDSMQRTGATPPEAPLCDVSTQGLRALTASLEGSMPMPQPSLNDMHTEQQGFTQAVHGMGSYAQSERDAMMHNASPGIDQGTLMSGSAGTQEGPPHHLLPQESVSRQGNASMYSAQGQVPQPSMQSGHGIPQEVPQHRDATSMYSAQGQVPQPSMQQSGHGIPQAASMYSAQGQVPQLLVQQSGHGIPQEVPQHRDTASMYSAQGQVPQPSMQQSGHGIPQEHRDTASMYSAQGVPRPSMQQSLSRSGHGIPEGVPHRDTASMYSAQGQVPQLSMQSGHGAQGQIPQLSVQQPDVLQEVPQHRDATSMYSTQGQVPQPSMQQSEHGIPQEHRDTASMYSAQGVPQPSMQQLLSRSGHGIPQEGVPQHRDSTSTAPGALVPQPSAQAHSMVPQERVLLHSASRDTAHMYVDLQSQGAPMLQASSMAFSHMLQPELGSMHVAPEGVSAPQPPTPLASGTAGSQQGYSQEGVLQNRDTASMYTAPRQSVSVPSTQGVNHSHNVPQEQMSMQGSAMLRSSVPHSYSADPSCVQSVPGVRPSVSEGLVQGLGVEQISVPEQGRSLSHGSQEIPKQPTLDPSLEQELSGFAAQQLQTIAQGQAFAPHTLSAPGAASRAQSVHSGLPSERQVETECGSAAQSEWGRDAGPSPHVSTPPGARGDSCVVRQSPQAPELSTRPLIASTGRLSPVAVSSQARSQEPDTAPWNSNTLRSTLAPDSEAGIDQHKPASESMNALLASLAAQGQKADSTQQTSGYAQGQSTQDGLNALMASLDVVGHSQGSQAHRPASGSVDDDIHALVESLGTGAVHELSMHMGLGGPNPTVRVSEPPKPSTSGAMGEAVLNFPDFALLRPLSAVSEVPHNVSLKSQQVSAAEQGANVSGDINERPVQEMLDYSVESLCEP